MPPPTSVRICSRDIARLKAIAADCGPLIEAVFRAAKALEGHVPVVYLEDYDLELARVLTSGVDLWLNTPQPPLEASGTSKASPAGPSTPPT